MSFTSCYEDSSRADAYRSLEFANTYYLAYCDLPAILSEHVEGTRALDFGCGTGKSCGRISRKSAHSVISSIAFRQTFALRSTRRYRLCNIASKRQRAERACQHYRRFWTTTLAGEKFTR
jgi:hypothetical protein